MTKCNSLKAKFCPTQLDRPRAKGTNPRASPTISVRIVQRSGTQRCASTRASEYRGATIVALPGIYVPLIVMPCGGVSRYVLAGGDNGVQAQGLVDNGAEVVAALQGYAVVDVDILELRSYLVLVGWLVGNFVEGED
ncbi:hypothetical protein PG988_003289 [Apiospora saccharicola]